MKKAAIALLVVVFVIYLIEDCNTLKVKDLPEPQSFKDAKKLAKDDLALSFLYKNREDCMANCKLVATCPKLSPECCEKKPIPECQKLDVVIAANKG
uniref:SLPTX10 n=1 Tax=Scolopendra viridis TaxID=118503 RepID=A0A4D5R9H1_SCOVI